MKITVLVDNNTYIDRYYLGEPAVSYYIEADGRNILFDTGYSDVFIQNAKQMEIDLKMVDYVVLSHGHNDHTGGLTHLMDPQHNWNKKLALIAHPGIFEEKYAEGLLISPPVTREDFSKAVDINLTKEPYYITENLLFLGEIPRENLFEAQNPVGIRCTDDGPVEDYVEDDTALVYEAEQGIYIITGCSHAGICNIIEYAKKITKKDRILGILGGFHLFDVNEQVMKTIQYFKQNDIQSLYPCHCTSLHVKAELLKEFPINEVGVGLMIQWD